MTLDLVIMNIFLYKLVYDRIVTCGIVSVTMTSVQFGLIRTGRSKNT